MNDWYDAGEPKPRVLQPLPRCANCVRGGVHHPHHPYGRCTVVLTGEGLCPCERSDLFRPGEQP